MDERTEPSTDAQLLEDRRFRVVDRIEVQSGVSFAAVIDSCADDSISLDLAAGRFPASTRPAVEYLQATTPPGGRILDLGTHVGTFTLAAAALGYEVLGVEASPRNASILQASLARNRFARVELVNAAVSDRPGSLEFAQGGPYGRVGAPDPGQESIVVPAVRVDDLLAERGWKRVDFIKMDIEGSEIAGLEGMARLLSGDDAPPIFIESNGHTLEYFGKTPAHLKSLLDAYGYRCYLIELGRLCPVGVDDFQPITCVDYLAVKRPATSLARCHVDRSLTYKEMVVRVVHSADSPHDNERRYLSRTLPHASPEIRASKRVHRAVERLRKDNCDEVRAAASAIRLEAVRPEWLTTWHRRIRAIRQPFSSTRRSESPRTRV